MRILYMGTAPFAVPGLLRLLDAGHDILGVVTQPDKPVGRKRVLQPSAVKTAAQERGLAVFQPERLRRDKDFHETARAMAPDLVAYAAYGQIIPQSFLDIPRLGCWNVHGSLLPKYRGAAPIQWSIIHGDRTTGVCVMLAEAGLDTGPVLSHREIPVTADDTAGTLGDRMADIGAGLLVETIAAWERGEVVPMPQDDSAATFAPSIEKEDARVDWSRPMKDVDALIRGMSPKPGAWTTWHGQDLKVWLARPTNEPAMDAPGTARLDGKRVLAAAGDGALELRTVQPAGKRPMPALDWARGWKEERPLLGTHGA